MVVCISIPWSTVVFKCRPFVLGLPRFSETSLCRAVSTTSAGLISRETSFQDWNNVIYCFSIILRFKTFIWQKHLILHFSISYSVEILVHNMNWLFPTGLLTSEDEYKWYWHQMIYFPETINTISTMNIYITDPFTFIFLAEHINSLCACWHPEAMKGSSSSSSCRLLVLSHITSPLFPCPGSTDAPCSRLRDPVPLSPNWRPHSQGPRTLPYRDLEHW